MILVVTGTGTGVGKTVVSAALCAAAIGSVAYLKAAQTGVPGDTPDIETVAAYLSREATLREGARFPDPMSPEAAARAAGLPPIRQAAVAEQARELAGTHDLVVLEGAGGLLVRFGPDGWTLADLAGELGAPVVVVTGSGLGTLNTTALTVEALDSRALTCAGVVVTPWPAAPSRLALSNAADLATITGHTPILLPQVTASDIAEVSGRLLGQLVNAPIQCVSRRPTF